MLVYLYTHNFHSDKGIEDKQKLCMTEEHCDSGMNSEEVEINGILFL